MVIGERVVDATGRLEDRIELNRKRADRRIHKLQNQSNAQVRVWDLKVKNATTFTTNTINNLSDRARLRLRRLKKTVNGIREKPLHAIKTLKTKLREQHHKK